jgi:hypothetical protein
MKNVVFWDVTLYDASCKNSALIPSTLIRSPETSVLTTAPRLVKTYWNLKCQNILIFFWYYVGSWQKRLEDINCQFPRKPAQKLVCCQHCSTLFTYEDLTEFWEGSVRASRRTPWPVSTLNTSCNTIYIPICVALTRRITNSFHRSQYSYITVCNPWGSERSSHKTLMQAQPDVCPKPNINSSKINLIIINNY